MKGFFADKPYPGRFIAIGRDAGSVVVIYGATGRSPSSLKRTFVEQGDGIYMTAVDATVAIEGNPDLLEYPAVRIYENGIVAANGNQIERIESLKPFWGAVENLSQSLGEVTYEPDEYRTPRITGCAREKDGGFDAALHIVRSASPLDPERSSWNVPLEDGSGSYIATYTGVDARPTASFSGEPLSIPLDFGSADATAQAFFDMLAPEVGQSDYRVGVIAAYLTAGGAPLVAIVNQLTHTA
jgi:IMP cyclohydrolase